MLVWGDTGWYLVVLDEHNLVLFGIKWYWFSKGLLSLYVLKIVEIWSGDTKAGRMNEQTRRDRANGPWKSEMSKKEIDNTRDDIKLCHWFPKFPFSSLLSNLISTLS